MNVTKTAISAILAAWVPLSLFGCTTPEAGIRYPSDERTSRRWARSGADGFELGYGWVGASRGGRLRRRFPAVGQPIAQLIRRRVRLVGQALQEIVQVREHVDPV